MTSSTRRWLLLPLLAAAIAILPATALADNERGDQNSNRFGPFAGASGDSGTCGPDWANDTYQRQFTVTSAGAGAWSVREAFLNGDFVTFGPTSPGACEGTQAHGQLVAPGIKGEFGGFLSGTVTGGTYNLNGCDTEPTRCNTTAGFIAAVFGPTAVYDVTTFRFHYSAMGEDLLFHHWVNASADLGGNRGDIATS